MTTKIRTGLLAAGVFVVSIASLAMTGTQASADIVVNGRRPGGSGGGSGGGAQKLSTISRSGPVKDRFANPREVSGDSETGDVLETDQAKTMRLINAGFMLFSNGDGSYSTEGKPGTAYTPSGFATASDGYEYVLMVPVSSW
jgi:hypothetical protein